MHYKEGHARAEKGGLLPRHGWIGIGRLPNARREACCRMPGPAAAVSLATARRPRGMLNKGAGLAAGTLALLSTLLLPDVPSVPGVTDTCKLERREHRLNNSLNLANTFIKTHIHSGGLEPASVPKLR